MFTDLHDADGLMWRAVTLSGDGLAIVGHDLGEGVERAFGCREYEFERHLPVDEVSTLRGLLGLSVSDDLLAELVERFPSTHQLETFVTAHGLGADFWSRSGD